MTDIRKEHPGDVTAIRRVNEQAFGRTTEAQIVDALRRSCPEALSLVAVEADRIVGHIFLTPVTLEAGDRTLVGMGLAPMAVLPEFQRRGIGSRLVEAGLAELEQQGCPFVVVLGHPEFYPRFDFVPASRYGIVSEYQNVPDEAFMIRALGGGEVEIFSGIAKYRPEFAAAT